MKKVFCAVFLLFILLIGCQGKIYDLVHIDYKDIYNQDNDEYLVYLYRNDCKGCNEVEPIIENYLKNRDKKVSYPIYAVNVETSNLSEIVNTPIYREYTGDDGEGTNGKYKVTDVTSVDDLYIATVPSLIKIKEVNNVKTSFFIAQGLTNITSYLEGLTEEYTISYDLDGGKFSGEKVEAFSDPTNIILPTATKEGYIFVGWEQEDIIITSLKKESYSLKAKWITPSEYTYIQDSEILDQNDESYFVYFMKDGCPHCINTKEKVLVYLYKISTAQFASSPKLYIVNLDGSDGKSPILRRYTGEGGQGREKDYFVEGVTSWNELYIAGTPSLIKVQNSEEGQTLTFLGEGSTSVMKAINSGLIENSVSQSDKTEYKITFNVNNKDVTNYDSITFYSWSKVSLPKPSCDGKAFLGWFDGDERVEEIETKNYELTAKWVDIKDYELIKASQIFEQSEDEYYIVFIDTSEDEYKEYLSIYQSISEYLGKKSLYVVDTNDEESKKICKKPDDGSSSFIVDDVSTWENLRVPFQALIQISLKGEVKTAEYILHGKKNIINWFEKTID